MLLVASIESRRMKTGEGDFDFAFAVLTYGSCVAAPGLVHPPPAMAHCLLSGAKPALCLFVPEYLSFSGI